MNAKSRIAVALIPLLGLTACASMDERNDYAQSQKAPSIMHYDHAYMSAVDSMARQRGIEVVWMNPPRTRRADRDDND